MPDSDKFDFDSLMDDDLPDSGSDFFLFDDEIENKQDQTAEDDAGFDMLSAEEVIEQNNTVQRRTSADFSPDMDALLLTAQSSMIVEAMKLISQYDFKSKNVTIFSEAIKGIDLYMKILERNPENFKKLTAALATDQDCMDVLKITYNLFRNAAGQLPESDSHKLKAFELIMDKVRNAYNKSLISNSIITIKKYFLLSGSIDPAKIDNEYLNNPEALKNHIQCYMKHINIAREMIKSGNCEIVRGMKGKEVNVFIVKATQLLAYYFGMTGDSEKQVFYNKLHDNFKKYFIVR